MLTEISLLQSTQSNYQVEVAKSTHHILVSICQILLFGWVFALESLVGDGVALNGGVVDGPWPLPRHHDASVILRVCLHVLRFGAAH